MMKWVCAFLLLASTCFADSLLVTASADGFIYPTPTAASQTKSFTISGSTTLVDMTYINGATLGEKAYNYGASKSVLAGKITQDRCILVRYSSLDDSMKALDSYVNAVYDSAVLILTVLTRPDSVSTTEKDSVTLAAYKLNTDRIFGEGAGNGAAALGANWFNYDSTTGTQNLWTTAGSGTSDYNGTEICTTRTIKYTDYAHTQIRFPIPASAISDTMNMAGLVIRGYRYGGNDGTRSIVTFYSDDADTSTYRPSLTVYYRLPEDNYGGAESLIVNSENAAKPILTYDISSVQMSYDLDSIRSWFYVLGNYSVTGSEGYTVRFQRLAKPANIGDNNGTQADAGEMHWDAWDERGLSSADSAWGTAGAENTASSDASTCNRSDGSGYDRVDYITPTATPAGTGWKSCKVDTGNVRKWLDDQCHNFALTMIGDVIGGDVGSKAFLKIEAIDNSDSHSPYIVIYYHPGATTRGTGRFGRDNTGVYRNDR